MSNKQLPAEQESKKWRFEPHYEVEDPYFIIANGPIVMAANEVEIGWDTFEEAEEAAQKIVDCLNQSDIEFHSESALELEQHIKIMELQSELDQWKERAKELEQDKGLTEVFVPCAEDDPRACGSYTSNDGQSLCYVRESKVPIFHGAGWVKGAPKKDKPHYAKVPSKIIDGLIYQAIIIPKGFHGRWWAVGDGFAFDLASEEIIEHLDESGEKEQPVGGLPKLDQPILDDADVKAWEEGGKEDKPTAPTVEIKAGLKFRNVHMPGYSFTVVELTANYCLDVSIVCDESPNHRWTETKWILEHTQWAFEKGEYYIEKEVKGGGN